MNRANLPADTLLTDSVTWVLTAAGDTLAYAHPGGLEVTGAGLFWGLVALILFGLAVKS